MRLLRLAAALAASTTLIFSLNCASAAPADYKIDPSHTFPSFEADHMGISVWRGKFNRSSGTVSFDKAAGTGTVDLAVDLASVDFGHEKLNSWARGGDFFDVKKHPKALYKGRLDGVVNGVPTQLVGDFTLHGVTRPMTLTIHSLKCIPHPLFKRELCGADASGSFDRDEFGLGVGKEYGFDMKVLLRIQVEALAVQ